LPVIAERVDLPDVRLHDLRDGFASVILKANVKVKVVSEALGHLTNRVHNGHIRPRPPGKGEQVASAIETARGEGRAR